MVVNKLVNYQFKRSLNMLNLWKLMALSCSEPIHKHFPEFSTQAWCMLKWNKLCAQDESNHISSVRLNQHETEHKTKIFEGILLQQKSSEQEFNWM